MSAFVTESELAAAIAVVHRVEAGLLQTRLERLTALLREHGIPLPDEDPRLGASDGEHLAACRRVVVAAYALLEQADELEEALAALRTLVGSGSELLQKGWR